MRKILILIRHAEALEGFNSKGTDFDRPLLKEAKNEYKEFIKYLKKTLPTNPQYIITSEAVRCLETAEIIKNIFGIKKDHFEVTRDLYNGDTAGGEIEDYYKIVANIPEKYNTVMIVAHNNTLTYYISDLIGEFFPSVKKGSVTVLQLKTGLSWKDIQAKSSNLLAYITPGCK